MDLGSLLSSSPELMDGLRGLGLEESQIGQLANTVGEQLGGGGGLDLAGLLGGLDLESFLSKIDVAAVAQAVGISPELAQSALDLIGPAVANFDGQSAGDLLGGLAKSFLK